MMWLLKWIDKTPYRKLYSYQLLRWFVDQFNNKTQKLDNPLKGNKVMNIKEYFIKLVAIFVAIYLVVVLPLANTIKSSVQGIDFALTKPSTKWIVTGLITNPETLYVLASQELEAGNKKKANMFINTAMGIVETTNTSTTYKQKFYKLQEKISSLPEKQ